MLKRQRDAEVFGAVIRSLRTERQLTQEQLAAAGGMERTYIALVEKAQRAPSLYGLIALAKALNLSLTDLIAIFERALMADRGRNSE